MNFFSGTPRRGAKHCVQGPPDDYLPEASKIWRVTSRDYMNRGRVFAMKEQFSHSKKKFDREVRRTPL